MQYVLGLIQTQQWQFQNKRTILPIILLLLLFIPETYEITKDVLGEAFWQVSSFVATTLIGYHFINRYLEKKSSINQLINRTSTNQVIYASVLGALPGCGGAIIVVTQFVRRQMGFGALVAVLTSTMGDAAFLLLATKPLDGLFMIVLGTMIGALSGVAINAIHGAEFMQPSLPPTPDHPKNESNSISSYQAQGQFWRFILFPSVIIALMVAFRVDVDAAFYLPEGSINMIGMLLVMTTLILWAFSPNLPEGKSAFSQKSIMSNSYIYQKSAQDTNFVTSWVIVAFLAFELTIYFTGWQLDALFNNYLIFIPLMAALIGLLPGCGPQILVTSLFIQGAIPFSAQIANGLSNDGDALFPAIALAPKAALIATIYSIIPALICGYGYMLAFE